MSRHWWRMYSVQQAMAFATECMVSLEETIHCICLGCVPGGVVAVWCEPGQQPVLAIISLFALNSNSSLFAVPSHHRPQASC